MLVSEIIEQDIINKMDNVLGALAFGEHDPETGLQDVDFCNIKWLKLYLDRLLINGNPHKVKAVNGTVVTILVGDEPLIGDEVFTLPLPMFLNGTLSNTKWEWNKYVDPTTKVNSERDKLPFIWLVSPTEERIDSYDLGSSTTVVAKLWFVHWSDWKKLNIDRQDEAIKPLIALQKEFIATMLRFSYIFDGRSLSYSTRDFPKFGTENENGIDKAMFDSTLSAVELDMNFKLLNRYCENC